MHFFCPASEFTQNVRPPQYTLFDMRISSLPFTRFSQNASSILVHLHQIRVPPSFSAAKAACFTLRVIAVISTR
jgi:hypothetical protein